MSTENVVVPPQGTKDWTWHWLRNQDGKPFAAQFRSDGCLGELGLARWFFSTRDTGLWALDLGRLGWRYTGPVVYPAPLSEPAPYPWRRPNQQDRGNYRLAVSADSGPSMAFSHNGAWYLSDGRETNFAAKMTVDYVQELSVPDELLGSSENHEVIPCQY